MNTSADSQKIQKLSPLPHDDDHEMNALGCVLSDGQLLNQVAEKLKTDDFYSTRHQKIYKSMLELRNEMVPISELTIRECLDKQGKLAEYGGLTYLGNLKDMALPSTLDYSIKKVKEASELRKLWEASQRLSSAITNGRDKSEIDKYTQEVIKIFSPDTNKKKVEVSWPKPLAEVAYYGLPGDFVKSIEPYTEADTIALLMNFLTTFGSIVGNRPHFKVGADKHPLRLFVNFVGESSKARKGTSSGYSKNLFEEIDPEWKQHIKAGLSSGEGLIWAVRDEVRKKQPRREKGFVVEYEEVIADEGVEDKRLLVIEGEFAATLRVLGRDGNILSAEIRNAWDTGDLQILTKNTPARATGAHIAIIGHITRHELRRYLTDIEAGNGFANRFLWFCVRRSKMLPFSAEPSEIKLQSLIERLRRAVDYAKGVDQITWAPETKPLWEAIYPELSEGKPGMIGAMTARAEAYVTRLSCIYAVLDQEREIKPQHLKAALAIWDYAEQSVRYIFQDATGDRLANEIWDALANKPEGMTRTEIYKYFNYHESSEQIEASLELLRLAGKVKMNTISTEGRPKQVWFLNEDRNA